MTRGDTASSNSHPAPEISAETVPTSDDARRVVAPIVVHAGSPYSGVAEEPLTIGVPVRRGVWREEAHLKLTDPFGDLVPVQTRVLDRWPDGSIRWVLLDFKRSTAHQDARYQLSCSTDNAVRRSLDRVLRCD